VLHMKWLRPSNFAHSAVVLGVCALGIVGCSSTPPAAPDDPKVRLAKIYVSAFMAGATHSMEPMENAAVKKALTDQLVTSTLARLTAANGAFESQGSTRTGTFQGHDVVYVACHFEHGALDAKVVLDRDSKVAGIFMVAPGGH